MSFSRKEFRREATGKFHEIEIELPRAFEYRVEITGDFDLQVPPETPFIYEASGTRPAWVDYSGPHYFYVPKGTKELVVDANPRLGLEIPGKGRRDLVRADREKGKVLYGCSRSRRMRRESVAHDYLDPWRNHPAQYTAPAQFSSQHRICSSRGVGIGGAEHKRVSSDANEENEITVLSEK